MTSTAETTAGTIQGAEADGVHAFKGVPYAAPPVGDLRFRPPAPLVPWDGVRDALEFGAACPQPAQAIALVDGPQSEDCLYLNVWTPAVDGGSRPVMVWLHGGGFREGSGSERQYHGQHLARRGDVVVVAVTHRIGVLGYLHLGGILGDEFASSGNNGMLDIIQALEWVRDNAAAFGGDPGNVTIFGESGGAAKVTMLHAMPAAAGLFHKAVIQSGPGTLAHTEAEATKLATSLLDELGWSPEEARTRLWEVPAEVLVKPPPKDATTPPPLERLRDVAKAQQRRKTPVGPAGHADRSPFVDGVTLLSHPGDAFDAGTAIDVPLLIGTNEDELPTGEVGDDDEALREALARFGDEHIDEIIDVYRTESPELTNSQLVRRVLSDSTMRYASTDLAERKLGGTSTPVWSYLFTFELGGIAAHTYEIPFVFDNVASAFSNSESRQKLADEMSEAWIAFARNGDPSHPGLPTWPNYTLEDRATMTFNRGECATVHDPTPRARELWTRLATPGSPS